MNASILGLMLAGVLFAGSALAQPSPRERRLAEPRWEESRPLATAPAGAVCRPWCTRDLTPCDPPNFKIADGRCLERQSGD